MAEQITIEGLNDLFAKQKDDVMAQVNAILAESQKKATEFRADSRTEVEKAVETALAKVEKPKEARLETSGALERITGYEIWDIPVGGVLVGGFVAVFATEIVDGFLVGQSGMIRGAVKLAVAVATVKWGKGLLGDTGTKVVALLVAFDAVKNDFIPQWFNLATTSANRVSGIVTKKGLGWTGGPGPSGAGNQALTSSQKMAMR